MAQEFIQLIVVHPMAGIVDIDETTILEQFEVTVFLRV
jgi:hypothetical protein